ncbi:MAG: glycosyltransferase family 4 protein [Pirellulales bacterium]
MRVLVIADPHIPVPPEKYGGTERIAHLLCDELAKRGYAVDLVAGKGSRSYGGRLYSHRAPNSSCVSRAYRKICFQLLSLKAARSADVVITFGRPDYLWALYRTSKPIVVRFANPLNQTQIDEVLEHNPRRLRFIGISQDHVSGLVPPDLFDVVPNAVDVDRYSFQIQPSEPPYVVFLGRMTANKGVHLAIQASRAAGVRLILAGNRPSEPGAVEYFHQEIEPFLSEEIRWVGPVNDDIKAKLLGGASAMLFPIQWREPFGIVMIEALACGCPVIAWRNGSVPEVVRHGETGFVVESVDQIAGAIRNIGTIDRATCRRDAELRFSADTMVDGYLRVIDKLRVKRTCSMPLGRI